MSRYNGVTYRSCSVCLGCGDVSGVPCSSCEATGVQPTIEALHLLGQSVCPLDPMPDGRLWYYRLLGCDAVLSDDPGSTCRALGRPRTP